MSIAKVLPTHNLPTTNPYNFISTGLKHRFSRHNHPEKYHTPTAEYAFVQKYTRGQAIYLYLCRRTVITKPQLLMYKKLLPVLVAATCLAGIAPLSAQTAYRTAEMQTEKLDRGIVAVNVSSKKNFISWRWLPSDSANPTFRLYRNGKLIAEQTGTNYTDTQGTTASQYYVETITKDGTLTDTSESITPWTKPFTTIHFNRPAADTAPNGTAYTYYPSDMGVADADGDGKMELLVKWQPTLITSNMTGYTGKMIFGCYRMDGTELWRINLGNNVRAGEHINQFIFYDMDGDGKAEFLCKTAPGSKDAMGNYVTAAADDEEIKTTDNTASYVASNGVVSMGPEYLTVFSGEKGTALHTVYYNPNREGGYGAPTTTGNGFANNYFGDTFGNRGDRLYAAVAYLDGKKPSAVLWRGCYQAVKLWAVDFDGKKLKDRWTHTATTEKDANGKYTAYGQGFHNLAIADVDADGKDEIITGAAVIDHDGTLLHSTGRGHGDAVHVGDFDPTRPGLEIYTVQEHAPFGYVFRDAKTGETIHQRTAAGDTGRGIIADVDGTLTGAEMWDSSSKCVYDVNGDSITSNIPSSCNYRIYWDGDLQDELLGDISGHNNPYLEKWNSTAKKVSRLYAYGSKNIYELGNSKSDHGTKGTPAFQGDILGDWREELIFLNSSDSCSINIFTTTTPTDYRVPCLLTDHIYRMATVWQNNSYNQPPYLGYWLPKKAVKSGQKADDSILDIENATDTGTSINAAVTESSTSNLGSPIYDIQGRQLQQGTTKDGKSTPANNRIVIQKGRKWIE